MTRFSSFVVSMAMGALLLGTACTSYRFTSRVPEELRNIAVPVFENETGFPEFDAIVTQQVLREFQREGTFTVAHMDSASLKLLGKLERVRNEPVSFDRNYGLRTSEYRQTLRARITLVERGTGKLLIDDMPLKATTTFLTRGDMLTGLQDAQPRIAAELSRAIVDAVLAYWSDAK